MRILVVGASGVVGRELLPLLKEVGHQVTALVRRPAGDNGAHAYNVELAVADALDRDALTKAVRASSPDAW
jgi:uncharacterized protein YbjT (DUF2867 family)